MTKLYGNLDNFRVQKVMIAAKLAGKKLDVISNTPPTKVSPLGLSPAIEDGDIHLFGAEAISKYILGENSNYFPSDPAFDQWIW